MCKTGIIITALFPALTLATAGRFEEAERELPYYLKNRGTGVAKNH